ncbi:MAG: SHOCT domain-containing protein [Actinobacteria bacterium]|nr:SHOCT domain-containing protein [Actinomycetota bacterium]
MPGYDDHMRDDWGGRMMGGYGSAYSPWLVVLLVAAVVLLVLAAVVVARLARAGGAGSPLRGGSTRRGAEQPEEMLDRLFAAGEIDEATYRARRTALAEMRQPVQHHG